MTYKRTLFAMALFTFIAAGGYAMIETLSLDNLVITSDVIIIADPKSGKETGKDEVGFIKVLNTVGVQEVLKGEVKAGSEIKVETLTGWEDEVVLKAGKKGVLFLTVDPKDPTLYHVNNYVQGFWPLDEKNVPLGMGTGTTIDKVKETVVKTKGQKPVFPPKADPADEL